MILGFNGIKVILIWIYLQIKELKEEIIKFFTIMKFRRIK